ncbi:hypothetical protein [Butyrivibrio sp. FCS014]|uniref:hypothetical protein n=1 Tax=Butyrivibrio sp. FCS014 TaxID=1408304 RepID=UPI00046442D4|nr:hypothetical protein [Butyrivibrio sp. FCS014]
MKDMNTRANRIDPRIYAALIFAAYLFMYITTASGANRDSAGILAETQRVVYYYADQLLLVAGLLVFGFLWDRINNTAGWIVLSLACAAYLICFFVYMLNGGWISYGIMAPVMFLAMGIIGAGVNYYLSYSLAPGKETGRIVTLGAAIAFLAQYIFQILLDNGVLVLTLITITTVIVYAFLKWETGNENRVIPSAVSQDKCQVNSDNCRYINKRFNYSIIVLLLLIILAQSYDSRLLLMIVKNPGASITPYSWPRIFVILGYCILGMAFDFGGIRIANVTCFAMSLWMLINPVLFAENPGSTLNMCIFYTFVGMVICYMYIIFWSIAPYTKRPALNASMGRVIDGSFGVISALLPWESMSESAVMIISILSVSLMAVALLVSGVIPKPKETEPARESEESELSLEKEDMTEVKVTEDDAFEIIAGKYDFTDREKEIFRKLVLTEDSGQEISDEMYISRRVYQRHVATLYGKTGAKSRVGLYQIYHDTMMSQLNA